MSFPKLGTTVVRRRCASRRPQPVSARRYRALHALFFALALFGCNAVLEYPPPEEESDGQRCADGVDNDYDGFADCDDDECDGFCHEESTAECGDGRDNDADGLIDTEDPRCWLHFPPRAKRCAPSRGVETIDSFDAERPGAPYSAWQTQGQAPSVNQVTWARPHATAPLDPGGASRRDLAMTFIWKTTESDVLADDLGALWRTRPFSGRWEGFELAFSASVPPGGLLRTGIVPLELGSTFEQPPRGADGALLSLTLDARSSVPLLSLTAFEATFSKSIPGTSSLCDDTAICTEYPIDVVVRRVTSGFRAELQYPDGRTVALEAPVSGTSSLSASRLVFWGWNELTGAQSRAR